MSLFDSFRKSTKPQDDVPETPSAPVMNKDYATMARLALNSIQDGFVVVDGQGTIKLINPAAVRMTGCQDEGFALGFDIGVCAKLEKPGGEPVTDAENPFLQALRTGQMFSSQDFVLVSRDNERKIPVAISLIPTDGPGSDGIITFRDISVQKSNEDAQSEFISTASHEMRTPVASIEGYLGLALNPQTATIDDRARGYLEAAHKASQHLGRLFRDLLDVTKLEDHRLRPHSVPLELTAFVKQIADEYIPQFKEKNLSYVFGARGTNQGMKTMQQPVYTFADVDFLREIVTNLVENAIKYTPVGKEVWVNVQGDETRATLTVEDSGIGISATDLQHIFQKFYRVDNSQTREIGGTGLGLYITKQRAEAMDGTAWAKSVYGKGSIFGVSLPRLTHEEFEKRRITLINQNQAQQAETARQLAEVKNFAQQAQQNSQNVIR